MDDRPRPRPAAVPCPNCRRLVSAQAERCLNCNLPRPGLFYSIPVLKDLLRGELSFADGLVMACFAIYVFSLGMNISAITIYNGLFDALSPSMDALFRLGMGGAYPVLGAGRWWTLITATFLHGSLLHIIFNMLWLRQIGPWVEELYGSSRFIVLYIVAGLVGSMFSVAMNTSFSVGASGSIFGLYGALIYYGYSRGGTFGRELLQRGLLWAAIGFVFSFMMPNVDVWAHLGGFLGGLAASLVLGYLEKGKQTLYHHLAALFTLLVLAVCAGLVLITMWG